MQRIDFSVNDNGDLIASNGRIVYTLDEPLTITFKPPDKWLLDEVPVLVAICYASVNPIEISRCQVIEPNGIDSAFSVNVDLSRGIWGLKIVGVASGSVWNSVIYHEFNGVYPICLGRCGENGEHEKRMRRYLNRIKAEREGLEDSEVNCSESDF